MKRLVAITRQLPKRHKALALAATVGLGALTAWLNDPWLDGLVLVWLLGLMGGALLYTVQFGGLPDAKRGTPYKVAVVGAALWTLLAIYVGLERVAG